MNGLRCFLAMLTAFITTAVLAQPGIEADTATASSGPDELSAVELVRELREARDVSEEPRVSLEEMLENGSRALNEMVEQQGCVLNEPVRAEIEDLQAQIGQPRGDGEPNAELRALQSRLIELRMQAMRSCCDQESIACRR